MSGISPVRPGRAGRPTARPGPAPPPRWRNRLLIAGLVLTVALGSDGSVSGKLTNGTRFVSSYPTSLQDRQFAQLLDQHDVQVTTQSARTSIWAVLLNFLPLALIVGLFWWTGRAAHRQLAGMGGIGGIGRARSRVFDAERPDTTFAEVAG